MLQKREQNAIVQLLIYYYLAYKSEIAQDIFLLDFFLYLLLVATP